MRIVTLVMILVGCILHNSCRTGKNEDKPLNIMLFTADDLDRNSLGCYGSKVPDISPHIDQFAREGLKFENAYVNAAICAPSRAIIATGLYGHNSGAMGFQKMPPEKSDPLFMELLREHGYHLGILGKVSHSTPKTDFQWDYAFFREELGDGRNPDIYYDRAVAFFQQSKEENKPFYFMVNSHDPHRPFFNPKDSVQKGAKAPSHLYSPDEIELPEFLPDLPLIREELSYYYNSTKRLDDTFGRVMQALDESGFMENTLVIFLSDNGIAVPFAKANTYPASNRTPWLVRWPGKAKAGLTDNEHYISEIDIFPTLLEAVGASLPKNLDGTSLLPVYKGMKQPGKSMVFAQIDSKISGGPVPMRSLQNCNYIYIFNAWTDGERVYENNNEGMTMTAMEEAALTEPEIAERVKMFRYRVPEEFYSLHEDPGCKNNLINDESYAGQIEAMREELFDWMIRTRDPLKKVFESRDSPELMLEALYEAYPEVKKFDQNKARYSKKIVNDQ